MLQLKDRELFERSDLALLNTFLQQQLMGEGFNLDLWLSYPDSNLTRKRTFCL